MQIKVSGIDVLVEKKNIKNMHLYVKPPLGKVSVSAPISIPEKSIENFVRLNIGWIKKQQEKYLNQPRKTERQYISGETYYIFGKQYFLIFQNSSRNCFSIDGNNIILKMKSSATIRQRKAFFIRQYHNILMEQLEHLIPKWGKITGLYCDEYKIRYMRTRWGSCNTKAKRIWINLQMIEKPLECLEYVILHELMHLKIRNHGNNFISEMNKYMPDWKERKNILNNHIL